MLFSGLILLLIIDCLALMLVVLLQSGKGGGLAAGFGGAGTGMEMMGSRQTATFLHNATRWLGGALLVISFAISLLTVRGNRPRSLIETQLQQEQAAPASSQAPGDLQDLLGGEGDQAQPAGTAAPGSEGASEGSTEASPPGQAQPSEEPR
ncbi:MAG: preprotein translocase subunit SecG [Gemmatimonadota bacterium]